MLWIALLLFWAQNAAPQQVQRGEALFTDTTRGCANCHALKGRGTAVGPDLKQIGRIGPHAIATAMRATLTEFVENVKPKSGDAFPGMPAGGDESSVKYYDVSKNPPELRQFAKSEVKTSNDTGWKHPPAVANYTPEQIADLVAYVRYAVSGSTKPVDPADVE
jgi:mono/diheme cytochrome c family protein